VFALLMIPCYAYIVYYAMRGHRAGLGAPSGNSRLP